MKTNIFVNFVAKNSSKSYSNGNEMNLECYSELQIYVMLCFNTEKN